MIRQLSDFPDNVVAFRCSGRITRSDYETVLVPVVLDRLHSHDRLRLYYETDQDFSLDPGAMWEDLKLGIEHLTRWEKIAVVTNVEWIRTAAQFFAFLMPAATKLFWRDDAEQAREWICE